MTDEPRKSWYGGGRQPWDDILDAGWGPAFAAGNVLKYLRRTKEPEHSLQSARWYWQRLIDLAADGEHALRSLNAMLTDDEKARLIA